MRRASWQSCIIAGVLAAAVALLLPLQTYLGNADIYPFSFWRLLPELMGLTLLFLLGFLAIGRIFAVLRLSPSSLFAALLVCVYLESGLLSLGIPELNGGFIPLLSDVRRGVVDACVWGAVIAIFIACSRWLKGVLHWISLAVLVLMVASLADVRSKSSSTASPVAASGLASGFESQPTVVANVRYSPSRNILVFILDSMPSREAADLMRTNGTLRAKFPGFVAYPNNVGMHECTKRGVPGLVTGIPYDPQLMPEAEYPMTMYGTNSFVTAAVRAGWDVAFSPDLLPYGFTNLPVERRVAREEKKRSRDVLALLRQSTEVPYLSLFDLVAFRLSPFLAKGPILYSRIRHAVKGRHSNEGFWGEKFQYAQLMERPVGKDARPFLGVFHTWGAHPPWRGGFTDMAAGAFGSLGELMDAYRAKGIYDKSLIVVTADHGLDMAKSVGNFPPSASALLWVKPAGASQPFAENSTQTSHARIAKLVGGLLDGAGTVASPETILRDEDPLYRAEIREGGKEYFKEWRTR